MIAEKDISFCSQPQIEKKGKLKNLAGHTVICEKKFIFALEGTLLVLHTHTHT